MPLLIKFVLKSKFIITIFTYITLTTTLLSEPSVSNKELQQQPNQARQILLSKQKKQFSAKREALEYLSKQQTTLTKIDLSCATFGTWDKSKHKCRTGTINLRELHLNHHILGHKLNLNKSNFNGADLWKAQFNGINFNKVQLIGTKLAGAIIKHSKFYKVNFTATDLYNASFINNNITKSSFNAAEMYNVHFKYNQLEKVKFDMTDLYNVNFYKTKLYKVNFKYAYLSGAQFNHSHLQKINFKQADLWNASFDYSYLIDINFTHAQNLVPEQLTNSWTWADTNENKLPALPEEWQQTSRQLLLFCHPDLRKQYRKNLANNLTQIGLPNKQQCKKWHQWTKHQRQNWVN